MASRFIALLFLSLCLCGCTTTARSRAGLETDRFSASGMARLDRHRFVIVNDTKDGEPGYRIGLLDFTDRSYPRYVALTANWNDVGGPSHDLEAACSIPGREGEFLIAESAYRGERYGRVFHCRLAPDERGNQSVHIIQTLMLPRFYDQIEGMACGLAANGNLILLLGERGTDEQPARLSWGDLTISERAISFQFQNEFTFTAPGLPSSANVRDCSDLFIDSQNRLWASAAIDNGDEGPFQSVIFQLGRFDPHRRRPLMSLNPIEATWRVDGFKIDAISESLHDPASLSFISDDENLGGIWRSLPRPR